MRTPSKPSPKVGTESLPDLRKRTMRILETAERAGDRKTALMAVGVLAKLDVLQRIQTADFLKSPGWKVLEEALLDALLPYPEATKAVGLALENFGGYGRGFVDAELRLLTDEELELRIEEFYVRGNTRINGER